MVVVAQLQYTESQVEGWSHGLSQSQRFSFTKARRQVALKASLCPSRTAQSSFLDRGAGGGAHRLSLAPGGQSRSVVEVGRSEKSVGSCRATECVSRVSRVDGSHLDELLDRWHRVATKTKKQTEG